MHPIQIILLASITAAHQHMELPVPFNSAIIKDQKENTPITLASQFPCNPASISGFQITKMNDMKVGDTQKLVIQGNSVEAAHEGGSCQLSITTDETPTASSAFKVIKSFQGGCPDPSGDGKAFDFKLPASIPNGRVTLAWSWLAKTTSEFYMNCAPVMVTGGANDASELEKLPDMLIASKDITSVECSFPSGVDVAFPYPGDVVETSPGANLQAPVGAGCKKTFTGKDVVQAPGAQSALTASSDVAVSTGGVGGVFAPGASSATSLPLTSTLTTFIVVTATPADPGPATSVIGSAPAAVGTGTSCPTDGAVVCNGTEQFGLCDHGQVVWQPVAAGTTCQDGTVVKRDFKPVSGGRILRLRFGHSHF